MESGAGAKLMAYVIKSYLVSLSGQVDQASFNKFAATLTGTSKLVSSTVGGIAGDLLKFQMSQTPPRSAR